DRRRRRQLQPRPDQRPEARQDYRRNQGRHRSQGARRAAAGGADGHARPGVLRAAAPPAAPLGDEEERHHRAQGRRPAGIALRARQLIQTQARVLLRRFWEHDLAWSFRRSPVTVAAAALTLACVGAALLSPWLAPQNPFDAGSLNLNDAFKPPAWESGGDSAYFLGTDNQGRDILSTIMYGARVSLGVGLASVLLSVLLGVSAGLVSGYFGGRIDAV